MLLVFARVSVTASGFTVLPGCQYPIIASYGLPVIFGYPFPGFFGVSAICLRCQLLVHLVVYFILSFLTRRD